MIKKCIHPLLALCILLLGFPNTQVNADTTTIPPAMNNLRAQMEIFYNSNEYSYANGCKEAFIKATLKKEKYSCRSIRDSYVVYKKISSKKYLCVDSTGFAGTVSKKPKTSKKQHSCGSSETTPYWQLSISEKLAIPLKDRHAWSDDIGHKYTQQVFWELRGETYSWKHDINKGSYLGVCKNKNLGAAYIRMMKEDKLENIECGDSTSWFYIKATLPDGSLFCLNRNDKDSNDSKESMENCNTTTKGTFKNVVKAN